MAAVATLASEQAQGFGKWSGAASGAGLGVRTGTGLSAGFGGSQGSLQQQAADALAEPFLPMPGAVGSTWPASENTALWPNSLHLHASVAGREGDEHESLIIDESLFVRPSEPEENRGRVHRWWRSIDAAYVQPLLGGRQANERERWVEDKLPV